MPAFKNKSLKLVCIVGQALGSVLVNVVVIQLMMYSNSISQGSYGFSQSGVKASASLTNAGSLAVRAFDQV